MRIQNEGAGKSSWWVINPDAKPGKAPRRTRDRGGSMDSKSMSMKTSRDRAMQRVKERKNKGLLNKDGTISPGIELCICACVYLSLFSFHSLSLLCKNISKEIICYVNFINVVSLAI